jgi:hypothetical protein
MTLGQARQGEAFDGWSRPWSAWAGTSALATGLVQMAWMLERIGAASPGLACTTQPERWQRRDAALLLWEAFVTGPGKPIHEGFSQHATDAAAAADTFAGRLEEATLTVSDVTCEPSTPLNLAAAAALFAGLTIPAAELRTSLQVYRTQPAAPKA